MVFCCERLKSIMEKGENAGYIFLFSMMVLKETILGAVYPTKTFQNILFHSKA